MKLLIFLCIALLFSTNAIGQTRKEKFTKKQDTTEKRTSVIVVKAARQDENILEAPLAVTIVPKKAFENNKGYGLDEALNVVPGVLVQTRSGAQDVRVVIRGFGARGAGERSNAGTSRGLRFYQDGIPETEPDGRTAFDVIDLSGASSIEVLRSNSSALWGNAAGGVVSISTIPTENSPFVSLQTQHGSFGFAKQSFRAGTPLDFGKMYIAVNNTNFDGWRDHSRSSLFQWNAGLLSSLSQQTSLNVFFTGASNFFQIPGPLTEKQFLENPSQAQTDNSIYNPSYSTRDERRHNRLGRMGVTLSHSISTIFDLTAMTFLQAKYLQRSERNTFRDFNRYHTGGNVVLRASFDVSETIHNKILIGLDEQYQDGGIQFYAYDTTTGGRGSIREIKREGANNFGVFAQEEIVFDEKLSGAVGVRFDRITYYNQLYYSSSNVPLLQQEKSFNQWTPKGGITWRATPTFSVYANVGGGVEVPAGNETDPPAVLGLDTVYAVNPLLEPIRSTTFEIGVKNIVHFDNAELLNSVSWDIAAYRILVVNDIIPYRDGRYYTSAGKSERFGAELGASMQFIGGISLLAAISASKNTYIDYTVDSGLIDINRAGKILSYNDNAMAGIPSFYYNMRLRYEPQFIPTAFIESEFRGVGSYYVNDANSLRTQSYNIIDISAGFDQSLTDLLLLKFFFRANNIGNAPYMSSVWINPNTTRGGIPYIESGLPRNFLFSAGLMWKL